MGGDYMGELGMSTLPPGRSVRQVNPPLQPMDPGHGFTEAQRVIRDLLSVMEIQEGREAGEYHLSSDAMRSLWDKAKKQAADFIEGEQLKEQDYVF